MSVMEGQYRNILGVTQEGWKYCETNSSEQIQMIQIKYVDSQCVVEHEEQTTNLSRVLIHEKSVKDCYFVSLYSH